MTGRLALTAWLSYRPSWSSAAARRATRGLPPFEPLPRAGQLVLIGDFLAPLDSGQRRGRPVCRGRARGHLLQIVDPAEEDLPFAGRVRFEGVEERDESLISRVETMREDYAERFRRHREGLAAIARAVGWTFRPPSHRPAAADGAARALRRAVADRRR